MKNTVKTDSAEARNAFWNIPAEQQLKQLNTTVQGLSTEEAGRRIKRYGANRLNNKKQTGNLRLFFAQFKSSIIRILLFATGLSFYLHDRLDAAIILTYSWQPAPTSAICSAWRAHPCSCLSSRYCPSKSC